MSTDIKRKWKIYDTPQEEWWYIPLGGVVETRMEDELAEGKPRTAGHRTQPAGFSKSEIFCDS